MEGTERPQNGHAPANSPRCSVSTRMEGTESAARYRRPPWRSGCSVSTRLEGTERCASVTIMPGTENPLEGFQLLSPPIHPLMKVIHSHFCIERIDSNLVELE